MYTPFDTLPPDARLWIYQSSYALPNDAQAHILTTLQNFIHQWTAHQNTLQAGCCILYNHFVIVGLNQNVNDASGCSIDKLTHTMQKIDAELNTNFFDRLLIAHQNINDEAIAINPKKIFAQQYINANINDDTLVFDTLIQQKYQLNHFKIPLKNSWHRRLMNN